MPEQKCRICKSQADQFGFLFKCTDETCGGVHWDRRQITKIKKDLKENPDKLKEVLSDANVPDPIIDGQQRFFVYTLRLRGSLNAVYVGMTGLHPYARYLNHVREYKASLHTKRNATALISYEGPMAHENAKKREPELANELRDKGYDVRGGH